jgi:hypothetical protein
MATKEELIAGVETVIREGKRVASDLSADELANAVDLDGWKGLEAFAHVAGTGALVPQMAGGIANAEPGKDAFGGINIDQINAGIVGSRAGKTAQDLASEIETNYRAVIEFIRDASDETLNKRATVQGYKDVPVSDLLMRMVVLHGLAHIYSVYSSVFNANVGK